MTSSADPISTVSDPQGNDLIESISLLAPALTLPERLVAPNSWVGHIPFAFWLVVAAQPRRFVELGVHTGNSYCAVAQAIDQYGVAAECFGIDHWFGDEQAGLYGEEVYSDIKEWHDPRYGHFSRLLRMSFEDGRAHVEDGSVDLLHIDGLHTYEAVSTDFETWRSKMSDRCIVLFHDTNVLRDDFGVWKYWQEIRSQYPTVEFLHSNGLGVAYTGSRPLSELPAVKALFTAASNPRGLNDVRHYFSSLGGTLVDRLEQGQARNAAENRTYNVYRELEHLTSVFSEHEENRLAIRAEREELIPRARKWDHLALFISQGLQLDPENVADAFQRLYNAANRQGYADRRRLRRTLRRLYLTGSVDISTKELLVELALRLKARLRPPPAGSLARVDYDDPDIRSIRESGLFDERYYVLTDAARKEKREPLEHYLSVGEEQNVAPSEQFDPQYYAEKYPDITKAGMGLLRHYCLHGRAEGRHGLPPCKRLILPALDAGSEGRRPILLFVHEASRTGAPVLAWNIARVMRSTNEVVVALKKDGPLREAFVEIGVHVVDLPGDLYMNEQELRDLAGKFVSDLDPAYVILNTIETCEFARHFSTLGVGVITLIHEYAAYMRDYSAVTDALMWSHRVVFPARSVARSFSTEIGYIDYRVTDILPQGLPDLPGNRDGILGTEAHSRLVRRKLRPAGSEGSVLVAGGGQVSFRKGVDLFQMVAARAHRLAPDGNLRFVWVGGGFEPGKAIEFSDVLNDQVHRSGLSGCFEFVGELDDLSEVYRQADIFVLSSRLDPLPNVAIEALVKGIPVICFQDGTGIAEFLADQPDTAESVVPYLDVAAMADTVLSLARDERKREDLGRILAERSRRKFSMASYVENLSAIGEKSARQAEVIKRDMEIIKENSGIELFSGRVFANVSDNTTDKEELIKSYLLRSAIALRSEGTTPPRALRRPCAGFNPNIYAEDVNLTGDASDPFAHWLKAGKPGGRWSHAIVALSQEKPTLKTSSGKVLLHAHFHYVDLAQELRSRLECNVLRPDLILTTSSPEHVATLVSIFEGYRGNVRIHPVPNRGRDIGAFLSGIDFVEIQDYSIVGHVHGKKSLNITGETGDIWRSFLWGHLIGDQSLSVPALDHCVSAIERSATLGLIFPEDANLCGWDDNFDIAAPLARQMGRDGPLPLAFEWPIGTMFWARPAALEPLFALGLEWEDYPDEPVPSDGTLLHALERLIPFAAEQAGFDYAASHLEDIQR